VSESEEMRTTAREWKLAKKIMAAVAAVAFAGVGTGAVSLYHAGRADGVKTETLQQLTREVERLRGEHDWLVKALFRLPAPPAGGPP